MDGKQKSVAAITQELQNCSEEALIALCSNLRTDPRKSVQLLAEKAMKRLEKEKKELERVQGMIDFEREIAGSTIYCGIDEAGRGPLAGPVVAAAVIMPRDGKIPYVNDSKQVSEKKREQLYEQILKEAVSYGVGIVDAKRIDEINILQATYEAMREAVSQLTLPLGHVLADAVRIPKLTVAQTPIIKGDAKCYSIANEEEGVGEIHNLRTRRIGNKIAIEMHVRMREQGSCCGADKEGGGQNAAAPRS